MTCICHEKGGTGETATTVRLGVTSPNELTNTLSATEVTLVNVMNREYVLQEFVNSVKDDMDVPIGTPDENSENYLSDMKDIIEDSKSSAKIAYAETFQGKDGLLPMSSLFSYQDDTHTIYWNGLLYEEEIPNDLTSNTDIEMEIYDQGQDYYKSKLDSSRIKTIDDILSQDAQTDLMIVLEPCLTQKAKHK